MAKYEVKNLKQFAALDGVCWHCTLYRDGKRVAVVENKGDGGENWYHWNKGCSDYHDELRALAAVAVPEYQGDLDIYFETLISVYEEGQELKKLSKKGVVVREDEKVFLAKLRTPAKTEWEYAQAMRKVALDNPKSEIYFPSQGTWLSAKLLVV
jgi:hypothetical protein